MKVYISNYRQHWISPYTILNYVFFWTDWSKSSRCRDIVHDEEIVDPPAWVETWAERLTPVSQAIKWVLDRVHPEVCYVKIDAWDTWSMDHTLAHMILPMLRQLQATKHGSPFVDDDDVPEHLRSTAVPAKQNEWDTDANHHARWDWALGEMIFAFECKLDDSWEKQFHTGEYDNTKIPGEEGWQGTAEFDMQGYQEFHKRITNGYRLFGKYYEALWD